MSDKAGNKGLRHFSEKVCEKVQSKLRTTCAPPHLPRFLFLRATAAAWRIVAFSRAPAHAHTDVSDSCRYNEVADELVHEFTLAANQEGERTGDTVRSTARFASHRAALPRRHVF